MSGRNPPLIVSIDVECDKSPDWSTASPVSFRGVCESIPARLQPLFERYDIRPTWLLSPEVIADSESCDLLRVLPNCELGSHLHGDYIAPDIATWDLAGTRTDDMQVDYPAELEREKLATLTEMFRQRFGQRPRSFRAGRFGASRHTGRILQELGYLVDSSLTPHICWTRKSGEPGPDFSGVRELPYWVSREGDLWRAGDSHLLEVPVTVRAPGSVPQAPAGKPVWFRPWYSEVDVLCAMVRSTARDAAQDGPVRPLVMMFHNVELLAGASPYPQSEAEVQRYLEILERVLELAREEGFEPRTLEELHDAQVRNPEWPRAPAVNGGPRSPVLRVSLERIRHNVDRHGASAWYMHSASDRAERWDISWPYDWLVGELEGDDPILDLGSGPGLNLQWLAEHGFRELFGLDIDCAAVRAGRDLARETGAPTRLWVDDGLDPQGLPDMQFAAICALNFIQLLGDFDLERFLARVVPHLRDGGYLLLDYISTEYDQVPNNQFLTSDWQKPETERRASEYRTRFEPGRLAAVLRSHGLEVHQHHTRQQLIPKGILVARRVTEPRVIQAPRKPRVLMVVDAPGWAHDHKTGNLARCLGDRFDVVQVFQNDLLARDIREADLVVVYYWRQLESLPHLHDVFERSRDKLLIGICSHNELESELRAPGLAVLRRLARAVFVHSELLYSEFAGLLDTPLRCLPNGVDTTFFTPGPERADAGPMRVGWAGSLSNFGSEMRGYSNVIEPAIAGIRDGVELVRAAREDRLRTPAEMREFYRSLDVYVCASRREGTPNPCLEAAACGVPLLTTRVGNMPEFVRPGVNGLFIDRDPTQLARALVGLRDDPQQRRRMGAAARETAILWDWRLQAEGYARLFDEVLASRTTGASHVNPDGAFELAMRQRLPLGVPRYRFWTSSSTRTSRLSLVSDGTTNEELPRR